MVSMETARAILFRLQVSMHESSGDGAGAFGSTVTGVGGEVAGGSAVGVVGVPQAQRSPRKPIMTRQESRVNPRVCFVAQHWEPS